MVRAVFSTIGGPLVAFGHAQLLGHVRVIDAGVLLLIGVTATDRTAVRLDAAVEIDVGRGGRHFRVDEHVIGGQLSAHRARNVTDRPVVGRRRDARHSPLDSRFLLDAQDDVDGVSERRCSSVSRLTIALERESGVGGVALVVRPLTLRLDERHNGQTVRVVKRVVGAPLEQFAMAGLTEQTGQYGVVVPRRRRLDDAVLLGVRMTFDSRRRLRYGVLIGDCIALVDLHVTFQVALVRRGVVAQAARKLLEAGMDGVVAPQQRAPAEHSAADGADVAVPVVSSRVVSQRRLIGKSRAATLEDGSALFVHRRRVPLQIVAPIRPVRTQQTRKQPLLLGGALLHVHLQRFRLGHV